MKLAPQSILGRTLAILLLGFLVLGAILTSQMYVERQSMLPDIGGWHVVSRITSITEIINETSPQDRPETIRSYQGPVFHIQWTPQSLLPPVPLDWRGNLVKKALEAQLGPLRNDAFRIGQATFPDRRSHFDMMRREHDRHFGRDFRHDKPSKRLAMVISLKLQDGTWLNFTTKTDKMLPVWRSRSFWPGLVLLIFVVGFSVWAVRRASKPLDRFAQAAERLGLDFNAPPLNEKGPREVARAAKAFNLMQSRLQAFIKDRTHMLAAISHDLRTPITRLKLRAEFIEDEEQRAKMLADLDEMEAMIAATLVFARDDAANEPTQELDLAQLTQDIVSEDIKSGVVSCELPETLLFTGRPIGLKRMLNNLVDNAKRFGEHVEVTLNSSPDTVVIVVSDNGPGIPEDMLDSVFDPFVRVETSRSRDTGGTGLGLSAVRSIAHAHGGTVKLSNREQGGLAAEVTLPRL
ncbi:MAG: ATP-binding protein [Magnetovibrio sp.]|nr:ATP-binding protein [Magnetovibrio sp.]